MIPTVSEQLWRCNGLHKILALAGMKEQIYLINQITNFNIGKPFWYKYKAYFTHAINLWNIILYFTVWNNIKKTEFYLENFAAKL